MEYEERLVSLDYHDVSLIEQVVKLTLFDALFDLLFPFAL